MTASVNIDLGCELEKLVEKSIDNLIKRFGGEF